VATKNPLETGEPMSAEPVAPRDRDRAVELAYESMSTVLADRLGAPVETHWELCEAAADAELDGEELAALRRLTELYEQAVYAPHDVSREQSRWVVEVATHLEELAS
jgi:hypothetical protein